MDKLLWDLFKKTGNIKYFMLIRKLEGEKSGDKESRGNNTK